MSNANDNDGLSDNDSLKGNDDFNAHDFEQFLASQPLREIPPHWRSEILQNAHALPAATSDPEPATPWWRALLWPNPLAWAAVACTWLLIAAMDIAARPSSHETPTARQSATPPDLIAIIIDDHPAAIEFTQSRPAFPRPAQSPAGACNTPRRRDTAEIA